MCNCVYVFKFNNTIINIYCHIETNADDLVNNLKVKSRQMFDTWLSQHYL